MKNNCKLLLALSIIILLSQSVELSQDLETQVLNGTLYPNDEVTYTIYKNYNFHGQKDDAFYSIFQEKLQRIFEINSNQTNWQAGINKFSFISDDDFNTNYLGVQQCEVQAEITLQNNQKRLFDNSANPPAFDWRDKGVVTPVKDQGACASSWTFSATGSIESFWSLKTQVAPSALSEQQMMDCSSNFENTACSQGLPSQAFEYIKYIGGLNQENVYSYAAQPLIGCLYNANANSASVEGGAYNITAFSESELEYALINKGPISVAFHATTAFASYTGGIFNDVTCPQSPSQVNHAVLLVGYGYTGSQKYWILKNSWGENWGENGYFRMTKGSNMCGIADCASYPMLTPDDAL